MPTKNYEKIRNEVVYMDGKQISGIQEIKPQEIRVKRSFVYRVIKLIRFGICLLIFKLIHERKAW